MKDDKLLPCPNPWCENKEGVSASVHIVTTKWHVCCDDCMIEGPWADTQSEAQVAWNTRPTPENGLREALAREVERVMDAAIAARGEVMVGEIVDAALSALQHNTGERGS